jgi:hypothetical protein
MTKLTSILFFLLAVVLIGWFVAYRNRTAPPDSVLLNTPAAPLNNSK